MIEPAGMFDFPWWFIFLTPFFVWMSSLWWLGLIFALVLYFLLLLLFKRFSSKRLSLGKRIAFIVVAFYLGGFVSEYFVVFFESIDDFFGSFYIDW